MTDSDWDKCTGPLLGALLISVERLDQSWILTFGGDITLATETLWRLIDAGRIVVTSEDHGHQFGLPEPVDAAGRLWSSVCGRTVVTASVSPSSGDLTIAFGEGTELQLLQTSSGYESWRLSVRGCETVCVGGGKIAHVRVS